jgi:hypothetical protein
MFFPSPFDDVRALLCVLKPGRKLALAVWSFADRNPFHFVLARIMDRYAPSPPPAPDAMEAFRFAPPGKLREVLSQAGVMAPSERVFQFTMPAPMTVDEFWVLRREMSDQMRNKIAALPPAQAEDVRREVLAAISEYATDEGLSFPGEVLIVSGAKPPSA